MYTMCPSPKRHLTTGCRKEWQRWGRVCLTAALLDQLAGFPL
jgi:hypothetical protein